MTTSVFSTSRLDAYQHFRSKKVQQLVTYCHKSCNAGEAVDIGQAAFRTSLNLLSNTIVSEDLTDPYEDSAQEFKELGDNITVEIGRPNLVDFFPVLKKLHDPQGIRRRMTVYVGKIMDIIDEFITKKLESKKLTNVATNADVLDLCLSISQESPEEIDILHIRHLLLVGTSPFSSFYHFPLYESVS